MFTTISISTIQNKIIEEIPLNNNPNAYSKIFLIPQNKQIVKIYYKDWELWDKNLVNLKLICNQISSFDFPEIVFPLALLESNNYIVGYLMPYIEGDILDEILTFGLKSKQNILLIFNKIASVINRLPPNIHIGDLHSKNIIVTKNSDIFLIDIDGFSIDNGYLLTCPININENIFHSLPKSKYFNKDCSVKISKNTDIYCLLKIFFTWLLGGINPFLFSKKKFKLFLKYLNIIGIPKEIIKMIYTIKKHRNNYLIPSLFLCFYDSIDRISYKDFLITMKIIDKENYYNSFINQIIGDKKNG
ncbi:MAG: hypothetical protein IKL18_09200 [Oscillospiraceae bacterium]|nr:hypothetical protein [Oscillospiraceae bacterium]